MARAAQMGKRLVARARGPEDDVPSDEPRVIPLDLLPLLAPHKRHGRLGLRVERLAQQTRLSKGTRNNDGSWSLVRDDLEDLEYIVPEGVEGAESLSIRIISLTGGNTLAVVDFPLDGAPVDESEAPVPAGRTDGASDDEQVKLLRAELAKLKAALAERDKVLSATPSADAAVAEAKAAWEAEADKRVAAEAAKAQAQIEQLKRTWEAEQNERLAKLEARMQEVAAEARAAAWREAREAAQKAENAWREEEAARLAAAEAQWQARAASAAAQGRQSDVELQSLREQLAAAQAKVAERDATLRQAKDEAVRVVRDADEAFAKAQAQWKSEETARLAAAEAAWQTRAAAQAAAGQRSTDELGALQTQVAELKAAVAQRDAVLAQAKDEAAKAARDAADGLVKAQAAWKADEVQRLAAAEAEWQKRAAAAAAGNDELGVVRTQLAEAKVALGARDAALVRAADEVAAAKDEAKAAVAEREAALKRAADAAREAAPGAGESEKDGEIRRWREKAVALEAKLVQTNKATEDERLKWQRDAQEAISRATKEWTAKEGARRASTEAQVRKEFTEQLAHATQRYEAAETALAQIRLAGGNVDGTRASIELDAARAALARREADVFRLRNELEELRGAPREEAPAPAAAPASNTKRYIRDAIVAGAIGVAVVVAYPVVEGWMTPPPPPPVVVKAPPPPPPPPPPVKTATLSTQGKLRAGPSNSTAVMTTLAKGAAVVVLDERDKWVRVRVEGPEAKPGAREGWVAASQLKMDGE